MRVGGGQGLWAGAPWAKWAPRVLRTDWEFVGESLGQPGSTRPLVRGVWGRGAVRGGGVGGAVGGGNSHHGGIAQSLCVRGWGRGKET